MTDLEQMTKRKNIVVAVIPKQERDVITIIRKVVKVVKQQTLDDEIMKAIRVDKEENAPITMKEKKGINSNICGITGNEKIYLSRN